MTARGAAADEEEVEAPGCAIIMAVAPLTSMTTGAVPRKACVFVCRTGGLGCVRRCEITAESDGHAQAMDAEAHLPAGGALLVLREVDLEGRLGGE